MFLFKNSCFGSFFPQKNVFFRAFQGGWILNRSFHKAFDFKLQIYSAAGFETCFLKPVRLDLKNTQRVGSFKKISKACRFLKKVLYLKKNKLKIHRPTPEKTICFAFLTHFWKYDFQTNFIQRVNGKLPTLSDFERSLLSKNLSLSCFALVKTTFLRCSCFFG